MDSSRVLDLLVLARALVEAGWCQKAFARTARGRALEGAGHKLAIQFCSLGAVHRAIIDLDGQLREHELVLLILRDLVKADGAYDITSWNDLPHRTQADVLALFDAACERVGKN